MGWDSGNSGTLSGQSWPEGDLSGALLILAAALHEQFWKQGMENSIAEAISLA
ncbi:hypothetical protein PISMIDRAFT_12833 [Pisolithus microcarpus 441]|uniref:Uncharacterized protein n=1 Tax=Pisolithus microcarpus 441 TaxID=765257 RepID=A0A0C9Y7H2_9AGAM|nr:hypothetical protein BKA83DRAFT_12833 [Pisolithus microcarpus]KIK20630.1 hypothetical protein PISMIDRAFT_12833 [Pisolithus microcarpus 441]